MECRICYEPVTADNIQVLECAHSLCQSCLGNLRSRLCPFCRNPIQSLTQTRTPPPDSPPPIVVHINVELIDDPLPRRRRRRRRRDPNRQIPTSSPITVPNQLTTLEMNEMRRDVEQQARDPRGEVRGSVSDRHRQERRSARNRWKYNLHNQENHNRVS